MADAVGTTPPEKENNISSTMNDRSSNSSPPLDKEKEVTVREPQTDTVPKIPGQVKVELHKALEQFSDSIVDKQPEPEVSPSATQDLINAFRSPELTAGDHRGYSSFEEMLKNGHDVSHVDQLGQALDKVPCPSPSTALTWNHITGHRQKVKTTAATTQDVNGEQEMPSMGACSSNAEPNRRSDGASNETYALTGNHIVGHRQKVKTTAATTQDVNGEHEMPSMGGCSSNAEPDCRSEGPSNETYAYRKEKTLRPHRRHKKIAVAPTAVKAGSYAPHRGPEKPKFKLPITAIQNLGMEVRHVEVPKDENIGTLLEAMQCCKRLLWVIEGDKFRMDMDVMEPTDFGGVSFGDGLLDDSQKLLTYTVDETRQMLDLRRALQHSVKEGLRLNREHMAEMVNLERKMRKHGQAQVQLTASEKSIDLEERCFMVQLRQSQLTAEAAIAARSLNAFKSLGNFYHSMEKRGSPFKKNGNKKSKEDEEDVESPKDIANEKQTSDGDSSNIDVSQTARDLRRQIQMVEARRKEQERLKRERNQAELDRINENRESVDVMDGEDKHLAKADALANKGALLKKAMTSAKAAVQLKFKRLLAFIDQGQASVQKLLNDMKILEKKEKDLTATLQKELEPDLYKWIASVLRGEGVIPKEMLDRLRELLKTSGGGLGRVDERQALVRRRDRLVETLEEREKKSALELELEKEIEKLKNEMGNASDPASPRSMLKRRLGSSGLLKPGLKVEQGDQYDANVEEARDKQRVSIKKAMMFTMALPKKDENADCYPSIDESNEQLDELRTTIQNFAKRANEFRKDMESAMPHKKSEIEELFQRIEEMGEATGVLQKVTKVGKKQDAPDVEQVQDSMQNWNDIGQKVHSAMQKVSEPIESGNSAVAGDGSGDKDDTGATSTSTTEVTGKSGKKKKVNVVGQGREASDSKPSSYVDPKFQAQNDKIVKWRTQNEANQQKLTALESDIGQVKQAVAKKKALDASLEKKAEELRNSLMALRQKGTASNAEPKQKSKSKDGKAKNDSKGMDKQLRKLELDLRNMEKRKEKAEAVAHDANSDYLKVSQKLAHARDLLAMHSNIEFDIEADDSGDKGPIQGDSFNPLKKNKDGTFSKAGRFGSQVEYGAGGLHGDGYSRDSARGSTFGRASTTGSLVVQSAWSREFPDDTEEIAKEKYDLCKSFDISAHDLQKEKKRHKLKMQALAANKKARRVMNLRQKLLMSFLSEKDRKDLSATMGNQSQQTGPGGQTGPNKFEVEYDRLKERNAMLLKLIDFWKRRIETMEQEVAKKQAEAEAEQAEEESRRASYQGETTSRKSKRASFAPGKDADAAEAEDGKRRSTAHRVSSIPGRSDTRDSQSWSYVQVVAGQEVEIPTVLVQSQKTRGSVADMGSPMSRELDVESFHAFRQASDDDGVHPASSSRKMVGFASASDIEERYSLTDRPAGWDRRGSRGSIGGERRNSRGSLEGILTNARESQFVNEMQQLFTDHVPARRGSRGRSSVLMSGHSQKRALSELMLSAMGGDAETTLRMQIQKLFELPESERHLALQELIRLERKRLAVLEVGGFAKESPEVQASERMLNMLLTNAAKLHTPSTQQGAGSRRGSQDRPSILKKGTEAGQGVEKDSPQVDDVGDFSVDLCEIVNGVLGRRKSSSVGVPSAFTDGVPSASIIDQIMTRSMRESEQGQTNSPKRSKRRRTTSLNSLDENSLSGSSSDSSFGKLSADESAPLQSNRESKEEDENEFGSGSKPMFVLQRTMNSSKRGFDRSRSDLKSCLKDENDDDSLTLPVKKTVDTAVSRNTTNGNLGSRRDSAPSILFPSEGLQPDASKHEKKKKKKKKKQDPLIVGKEIGQASWKRRYSVIPEWSEEIEKDWAQAIEGVRQAKIRRYERWQKNVQEMQQEMSSDGERWAGITPRTQFKDAHSGASASGQMQAAKAGRRTQMEATSFKRGPSQRNVTSDGTGSQNTQMRWLNVRHELRTLIDTAKKEKEQADRGWDTSTATVATVDGLDSQMQTAIGKMARTVNEGARRTLRSSKKTASLSVEEIASRREARIRERLEKRGNLDFAAGSKGEATRVAARKLDEMMYAALDEAPKECHEVDDLFSQMNNLIHRSSVIAGEETAKTNQLVNDNKGNETGESAKDRILKFVDNRVERRASETNKSKVDVPKLANSKFGRAMTENTKRQRVVKDGGLFENRVRDRAPLSAVSMRRASAKTLTDLALGGGVKNNNDSNDKAKRQRFRKMRTMNDLTSSDNTRDEGMVLAGQALIGPDDAKPVRGRAAETSGSDAESSSEEAGSSEDLDEVQTRRNRRGGVRGPLNGFLGWADAELRERLPDGGSYLEEKLGVKLMQVVQAAILGDMGYWEALLQRPREEFVEAMCRMVTAMQARIEHGHFEMGQLAADDALNSLVQVNWRNIEVENKTDAREAKRRQSALFSVPMTQLMSLGQPEASSPELSEDSKPAAMRRHSMAQGLDPNVGASETPPFPSVRRSTLFDPSVRASEKRRHTLSQTVTNMSKAKSDSGEEDITMAVESLLTLPGKGAAAGKVSPTSPGLNTHALEEASDADSSTEDEQEDETKQEEQSNFDKAGDVRSHSESKDSVTKHEGHQKEKIKANMLGLTLDKETRPCSAQGSRNNLEKCRRGSVLRGRAAQAPLVMDSSPEQQRRRSDGVLHIEHLQSSRSSLRPGSASLSPPLACDQPFSEPLACDQAAHVARVTEARRMHHHSVSPSRQASELADDVKVQGHRRSRSQPAKRSSLSFGLTSRSKLNPSKTQQSSPGEVDQLSTESVTTRGIVSPSPPARSPSSSPSAATRAIAFQSPRPPSGGSSEDEDVFKQVSTKTVTEPTRGRNMINFGRGRNWGTVVRADAKAWHVSPEAMNHLSVNEIQNHLKDHLMLFRREDHQATSREDVSAAPAPPAKVDSFQAPSNAVPWARADDADVPTSGTDVRTIALGSGPLSRVHFNRPQKGQGLHPAQRLPPLTFEPTQERTQSVAHPQDIEPEISEVYQIPESSEQNCTAEPSRARPMELSPSLLSADNLTHVQSEGNIPDTGPVATEMNDSMSSREICLKPGLKVPIPSGWVSQPRLHGKLPPSREEPRIAGGFLSPLPETPRFADGFPSPLPEVKHRTAITRELNADVLTGEETSRPGTKGSMPDFQNYLNNFSVVDFDAMMQQIPSRPGTTRDMERVPKAGVATLPTLCDTATSAPPNHKRLAAGDVHAQESPQLPAIKAPMDKMNSSSTSGFGRSDGFSRKSTAAGTSRTTANSFFGRQSLLSDNSRQSPGTTANSFFNRQSRPDTTDDIVVEEAKPEGKQKNPEIRRPQKKGLGFLVTDLERQLHDIKREKGGGQSTRASSQGPGLPRPSSKWKSSRH